MSEELTLVTNRFRDFKNSLSYSSNVVSYSSSSSGAHTQLDPPEILTTAFSSGTTANINSISTLGYTGLSNQVGGAPPGKAAPSGSATLYDKDGIPYHAMDKKKAEKRIRNQQGFRRACDHDLWKMNLWFLMRSTSERSSLVTVNCCQVQRYQRGTQCRSSISNKLGISAKNV